MKKISLILILSSVFYTCSDSKTGEDLMPKDGGNTSLDSLSSQDSVAVSKNLICLFEKVSLLDNPNAKAKWLKTLSYGRELHYLADTTINNKKYYQAKIAEGETGWVSANNVSENSQVWVVTNKVSTYAAPDPLTITEKSFDLGELIVIKNEKIGDFHAYITKNKRSTGYIKGENAIANDPIAIETAQIYNNIISKTDAKQKEEALVQFMANEQYAKTIFAKAAQEYLTVLKSDSLLDEKVIENKLKEEFK